MCPFACLSVLAASDSKTKIPIFTSLSGLPCLITHLSLAVSLHKGQHQGKLLEGAMGSGEPLDGSQGAKLINALVLKL